MKSLSIFGFKKNGVENEHKGRDSSFQDVLTVPKHIHVFQCASSSNSFF